MLSRITRTLIITLAFLSTIDRASAQAPLDADAKELKSYTLTTTALKQFAAATRNMMTAAKADPRFQEMAKLKAEVEKLEAKEEPTEADDARLEKLNAQIDALESKLPNINVADARLKTLSDIEAAIKKEPLALNALNAAGMAPRDYAKFSLAFFQAAMLHGMQKAGVIKEVPKDLQATVNMDNVKFIEANQAEINALMAEFQAASKQ